MTRAGQGHNARARYGQRSLIVGLVLAFIITLWSVQLFIVIMMLDAFLGGQTVLLWPSAIASILIAMLNLWMLRLIPKEIPRQK